MAMASSPEAQNRLMVTPGTVSGRAALWQAMRAMFIPWGPSGMAQPRMTSSIWPAVTPGARRSTSRRQTAARSSGRTERSFPPGAFPVGVRAAETMKTSFMVLIPQGLAGFQGVLDSFHRFGLAAQAQEHLAFEIEDVLFGHKMRPAQIAAAEHMREFGPDLFVVPTDLAGLAHLIQHALEQRQTALTNGRKVGALRPGPIARGGQLQNLGLRLTHEPVPVQHQGGFARTDITIVHRLCAARGNFRQADRLPG